jgi:hypothetical protein
MYIHICIYIYLHTHIYVYTYACKRAFIFQEREKMVQKERGVGGVIDGTYGFAGNAVSLFLDISR